MTSVKIGSPLDEAGDRQTSTAHGYDVAAEYYDRWDWQLFWRANEFPIVRDLLLRTPTLRRILDVGTGTGAFLDYISQQFHGNNSLAGVDLSAGMLALAQKRLGARAELCIGDIQAGLPFRASDFDAVTMMRVANHLSNLDSAILEIHRLLSPGGIVIATDLAEEYEYACTQIRTVQGTVKFDTVKHSRDEWQHALARSHFANAEIQLFGYSKLRDPNAGGITHKLSRNDGPIFQVIVAQKAII
jgi:ubiquinone/menaquinone biosynthesis C-methylase UbiE